MIHREFEGSRLSMGPPRPRRKGGWYSGGGDNGPHCRGERAPAGMFGEVANGIPAEGGNKDVEDRFSCNRTLGQVPLLDTLIDLICYFCLPRSSCYHHQSGWGYRGRGGLVHTGPMVSYPGSGVNKKERKSEVKVENNSICALNR